MKSVFAATAFATVALAANSTTTSPLIPTSNISSGCSAYMASLNADTSLTACFASINTAAAAFGPTASAAAPKSAVAPALAQLCASTSCDEASLRSALAAFYAACPAELVGAQTNADVVEVYDALYMVSPMKTALCTKSGSDYCVSTLSASAPSSKRELAKRDAQAVLKPNAATYSAENVAFLRLSPSASNDVLCGDCSRAVQQAWIDALNAQSYAPGIAHSALFAGQAPLYDATTKACGTDFFSAGSSVNNVGGGLAGGVVKASGAASARQVSGLGALLGAAVLGAMAL